MPLPQWAAIGRALARRATPLAAWLAPLAAGAQVAASSAAPMAHPVDGPSFMPMGLALLLVLALIGATLWLLRRTGIAPARGGTRHLRLVSQLALGPRERVVIVEVGDRWWLLGVGAGGISRLGTVPKGEAGVESPAPSFGNLLEKLRGGSR